MLISAKLLAVGVGLPGMWLDAEGGVCVTYGTGCDVLDVDDRQTMKSIDHAAPIDMSDPQTAFGVALRLDEWEDHERPMKRGSQAARLALVLRRGRPVEIRAHIRELVARLTQIGQDRAIRRALGWTCRGIEIEPGVYSGCEPPGPGANDCPACGGTRIERGTLATLEWDEGCKWWVLSDGGPPAHFSPPGPRPLHQPPIPALAGITDPVEALAAIYIEVTT